jgi:23S rRNA (uracil1939-C5)-methyltransferase
MPNHEAAEDRLVTITKLVSGGYGLGEYQGKKGFIRGAYPGEKVRVKVTEEKKNLWFGYTSEVMEASSQRRPSPCEYSSDCGGCPWIDLQEGAQTYWKKQILQETFTRLGGISMGDQEIMSLEASPFSYRSRAQVHWNGTHLGFKAQRSDQVVPLEHCQVLTPEMDQIWQNKKLQDELGIKNQARTRVLQCDQGPRSIGKGTITLAEKNIQVEAAGFFQSNRLVQEKLLALLQERMQGESLLDLYGGVGVFASALAGNFRKIWLVESHRPSADCARENLREKKAKVFSGTVEAWSRSYPKAQIDWAIVDPPRTGLKSKVVSMLIQQKPRQIAYVSCNPDTQARDLRGLLDGGYLMGEVFLLDFYPQTPHVETLVFLEHQDQRSDI